ncbi:hypothetical protein GYH30_001237 [Glycine max]|uniref:Ribulose bisphosphate carboxylase/oxygenase activase AAA helical domain-containing protein n=1 Tax=Glycine max TaxID=3847 RepID=K7K374_SOYBN|nr:ribulose bisphosphate carboxylase/oxygenase activase, chloroplastic [Glycine max]KAH1162657.1 hypothetical protein GYH30_001237 [Glycine max]|eukprot:XP_003516352.1 ribulose bisphosphate carboxylase/oxygenase activase, chloroplastic [Glycine max]
MSLHYNKTNGMQFMIAYFFGALKARVYDDEVRKWISVVGVDFIGKKLVNSKEGPPNFDQPKMTLSKLLEYGNMLVQEQENVERVQLADMYLKEAALGDANQDSINRGTFYGLFFYPEP